MVDNPSSALTAEEAAKKIFEAIERDLRDRRGLKHEWSSIDESIQQEIRDTNIASIAKILGIRWKEEQGRGDAVKIGDVTTLRKGNFYWGLRHLKSRITDSISVGYMTAGTEAMLDELTEACEITIPLAPPPPDERVQRLVEAVKRSQHDWECIADDKTLEKVIQEINPARHPEASVTVAWVQDKAKNSLKRITEALSDFETGTGGKV
jgi:hypothetical protein